MPSTGFSSGSLSSPNVDLSVDTGNALLNHTIDGFFKIGAVAVAKVAAEESYHMVRHGSVSKDKLGNSLKKMCQEGVYWGTVAGVYIGMEYGAQSVRGRRDWVNAMIGGALTGALTSAVSNGDKGEKLVMNAIAGGAVATASVFVNQFHFA